MKYSFEPGDILAFKETEDSIGHIDLSLQGKERAEKNKAQYRKFRGEVIRILEDRVDKDGDPCFRLKRLDTKAHGLETWSQGFFVHAKD